MSLEEKVRYDAIALSGAALVFSALGVHIAPLDVVNGYGN
jgi:hypothetical protein